MLNCTPRGALRALLMAGIAPACLWTTAAYAQSDAQAASGQVGTSSTTPQDSSTSAAPAENAPKNEATLSDIIVTAARRAQNLQTVSQAVSVVSGAKISEQGLSNIGQILDSLPGVQATSQPSGFSIDVRGQGGDLPAGASQGQIALEFDGIYNITAFATIAGFFDVDRVEVLPGPQSTRYGPNADGGVVNVISKDPVIGSTHGFATLTVGSYGLIRGELAQNIPLTDTLAVRVAGVAIHRNSYFTPATSNAIAQSGRIKLLWQPSSDLTVKLGYEINHVGGTGPGYELAGGPPIQFNEVAPYKNGDINNGGDPWHQGDVSTGQTDADSHARLYQESVTGNVSLKLGDIARIDELAGYSTIHGSAYVCGHLPSDTTGGLRPGGCVTGYPFAPYYQISSETRLHNTGASKVQWNIGYYHFAYKQAAYTLGSGPFVAAEGSTGFYKGVTNAVFGEVTYPVSHVFRVIGGARESFDTRYRNFGFDSGLATPTFKRSYKHFDYRAGVEYDAAPRSLLYATVSSGYRPGGLGSYSGSQGNYVAQSFPNEVNTSFEVGSKNRFFDNRLQLNVDAFYYRQRGFQFIDHYNGISFNLNGTTVVCANSNFDATNVNAALYAACQNPTLSLKAHVAGLEGQMLFNLTRDDQIGLSATFLSSKYDKNQTSCATLGFTGLPAGVCAAGYNGTTTTGTALYYFNLNGADQPHSPKFSTTFSYHHIFHLGSSELNIGGQGFYTTGYYVHPVEIPESRQSAYITGQLSGSFTPASQRWSLSAFANNINNYAVKQGFAPATTIGDPRTYGVTANIKW